MALRSEEAAAIGIKAEGGLSIRFDFTNTFKWEAIQLTPTAVEYNARVSAFYIKPDSFFELSEPLDEQTLILVFEKHRDWLVNRSVDMSTGTGKPQTIWHEPTVLVPQMIRQATTSLHGTAVIWPNVLATADALARARSTLYYGIGIGVLGLTIMFWNERTPLGHCRSCGYDLRATPAGSPCPECGRHAAGSGGSA